VVIVGRYMEGITINPLEYLLDDFGQVREFADEETAKAFLYDSGFTEDDIYWFTFKPADEKYLKVGKYIEASENSEAIIEREFYGQGYIYKDEKAYENSLNQVCYIPELGDTLYTHQSFLDMCDNQEALAWDIFDQVDWQHPETLLEENFIHGEYDNCEQCGRMFISYNATECPHCHRAYQNEKGWY